MAESIVEAVVRILRRQIARGRRTAPLTPAVQAALFAPAPAAAASRTVERPAPPPARADTTAPTTPENAASAPPPRPAPPDRPTPAAPRPAPPAPALSAAEWPTPPALDLSQSDWQALRDLVTPCRRCPLCQERTQAVFGEGPADADLMFIGEAPGRDEDLQGVPFVGAAGQLLTRMIEAMQFSRDEVYIANIVKCRPPRNRIPDPSEAEACLPYLRRQIALVRPKVIVTLGATPLLYLLGKTGITRTRGQWAEIDGIPTMPTYHPAYLLRAPERKAEVWEDLKAVMVRLGRDPTATTRRRPERPAPEGPPDRPTPDQAQAAAPGTDSPHQTPAAGEPHSP